MKPDERITLDLTALTFGMQSDDVDRAIIEAHLDSATATMGQCYEAIVAYTATRRLDVQLPLIPRR